MKLLTAAASFAAVQASPVMPEAGSGDSSVSYTNMGSYLEKNFDWANFDQEVKNGIDSGYNTIYLGFYMSLHGCQGACTAWRDLQSSVKDDVLKYAEQNNAQIVLSIGGPGEFVEGIIRDGQQQQFAQNAAEFAFGQGFTAIDIATELSGSLTQPSVWATNGSYSDFISTMIEEASKFYTPDYIHLTSPAQYFSPAFVECTSDQISIDNCTNALSYFALNSRSEEKNSVKRINLDMLNEDTNYLTYQQIFVNDDYYEDPYGYGNWGKGSAVQQIMNINTNGAGPVPYDPKTPGSGSGIDGSRIAIVKSQSPDETAIRSGYVDPQSLNNWGCQANQDFSWTGGFVGWTWNTKNGYNSLTWPGELTAGACECLINDTCYT